MTFKFLPGLTMGKVTSVNWSHRLHSEGKLNFHGRKQFRQSIDSEWIWWEIYLSDQLKLLAQINQAICSGLRQKFSFHFMKSETNSGAYPQFKVSIEAPE